MAESPIRNEGCGNDSGAKEAEQTRGQPASFDNMFEIWNLQKDEAESSLEDSNASTSLLHVSSSSNASDNPIIDKSRWWMGYSSRGKKETKLVVRSLDDLHEGRVYTVRSGYVKPGQGKDYLLFTCPCRKMLVSSIIQPQGERIVIGDEDQHECPAVPFRELFFQLKKSILLFGTNQEIIEFESATVCETYEPEYTKVNQRDWVFADSNEAEKNSLIFVREAERSMAREYILQKGETTKNAMKYACTGCHPDKKAILLVYNLPSCLQVAFRPPDVHHSSSCAAEPVKDLASEHGKEIVDISDMDIYRVVPRSQYVLGFSSAGERDGRLIVKEESDPSLCREYGKLNKASKFKLCCLGCQIAPYFAHYMTSGPLPRVVAPNVNHGFCIPKSFDAALKKQQDYGSCASARVADAVDQSGMYSHLPMVPRDRFKINRNETWLVIRSDVGSIHQYKLCAASLKSRSSGKIFECISCSSIAVLNNYVVGRMIIRSDMRHEDACIPIDAAEKLVDWSVRGPVVPSITASVTSVLAARKKSGARQLNSPFNASNSSINDLLDQLSGPVAKKRRPIEVTVLCDDEAVKPDEPALVNQSANASSRTSLSTDSDVQVIFPETSDCPVDLEPVKDVEPAEDNEVFMRPSTRWLKKSCRLFNVPCSDAAYRIWAMLENVNWKDPAFPTIENTKVCKSGFSLISYLLTGSEEHSAAIKETVNKYFYENQKSLGNIAGTDCRNLSHTDLGSVLFAIDMVPVHFALISKLLECTVVIYNYECTTCANFEAESDQAPTIVVGFKADHYFLFVL